MVTESERVNQVLKNLLLKAIKLAENGTTIKVESNIQSQSSKNSLHFCISYNGNQVTETEKEFIFSEGKFKNKKIAN